MDNGPIPAGTAPEHGIVGHRGDAHARTEIPPAVTAVAEIVRNDPEDQQHHQKDDHRPQHRAHAGRHVSVAHRFIATAKRTVALTHGGDVVFLHCNAIAFGHVVHQGVKGTPHRRVIAAGHEVILHIGPEDALKALLLAVRPAAAPAHIIVAAGLTVIIVLQSQHQQNTVVALRGAHAKTVELLLGIEGNVLAAGGVDDLKSDLGTGLGKEGGIHGVDIGLGVIGDDTFAVHHILVGSVQRGGGRGHIGRLAGLAQHNAQYDTQHHHRHSNGAFFKEFFHFVSPIPVGDLKGG